MRSIENGSRARRKAGNKAKVSIAVRVRCQPCSRNPRLGLSVCRFCGSCFERVVSMSRALIRPKCHSFKENTDCVAIIYFPSGIMLQDVSQSFGRRKQDISDSVLLQNFSGIFELDQIQVVAKYACILKNINAAIDEHFHLGFIEDQVATPLELIQNRARRRMSPQVWQNLCRILPRKFSLQCSLAHQGKTVNDAGAEDHHQHHINNRLVEVRLIRRYEVQQLCQQWRRDDTQKKEKTNVSDAEIYREEEGGDLREKPAPVTYESYKQKSEDKQDGQSSARIMKAD